MRQAQESADAGTAYQLGLAELAWYQGGEYMITNETGTGWARMARMADAAKMRADEEDDDPDSEEPAS